MALNFRDPNWGFILRRTAYFINGQIKRKRESYKERCYLPRFIENNSVKLVQTQNLQKEVKMPVLGGLCLEELSCPENQGIQRKVSLRWITRSGAVEKRKQWKAAPLSWRKRKMKTLGPDWMDMRWQIWSWRQKRWIWKGKVNTALEKGSRLHCCYIRNCAWGNLPKEEKQDLRGRLRVSLRQSYPGHHWEMASYSHTHTHTHTHTEYVTGAIKTSPLRHWGI